MVEKTLRTTFNCIKLQRFSTIEIKFIPKVVLKVINIKTSFKSNYFKVNPYNIVSKKFALKESLKKFNVQDRLYPENTLITKKIALLFNYLIQSSNPD